MKSLLCTASALGLLVTASAWAANAPPPTQGNANPPANAANPPAAPQPPQNSAGNAPSGGNTQPGNSTATGQSGQAGAPASNTASQPSPNQPNTNQQTQAQQAGSKPSSADSDFVQHAATGGKAEVAMGKLAEQRGAVASVREFGRWMVTDHTQANHQLAKIAQQSGMQLPSGPDKQQQAAMAHIEKLHGTAFDRAYIAAQLKAHEKTVDLFRKEAQSGQDTQLKQFAQQSLPMLEQHLTEVQELAGTGHKAAAHGPVHLKPGSSTAQLNQQELNQVKRSP